MHTLDTVTLSQIANNTSQVSDAFRASERCDAFSNIHITVSMQNLQPVGKPTN